MNEGTKQPAKKIERAETNEKKQTDVGEGWRVLRNGERIRIVEGYETRGTERNSWPGSVPWY